MREQDTDSRQFDQHADEALHLANSHTERDLPCDKSGLRELECCSHCHSELVQPVRWEEAQGGFVVLLRCPECQTEREGEFSDAELERYDDVLDFGCYQLVEDLKRLEASNMQEWVELFLTALRGDHIQSDDF